MRLSEAEQGPERDGIRNVPQLKNVTYMQSARKDIRDKYTLYSDRLTEGIIR